MGLGMHQRSTVKDGLPYFLWWLGMPGWQLAYLLSRNWTHGQIASDVTTRQSDTQSWQHNPQPRLLHPPPVPAQGFYYANGVALSPDESYVVMAETDQITAHKVWVKGPKVLPCLATNCPACIMQTHCWTCTWLSVEVCAGGWSKRASRLLGSGPTACTLQTQHVDTA